MDIRDTKGVVIVQTIEHIAGYKNIHWLLDEIEQLYADLSDSKPSFGLFENTYDISLSGIYECFRENSLHSFNPISFKDNHISHLELPKYDPKNIIVCYSGGKDSLIAIRHYQKLGYNVYAYHIKGLNQTYVDEWKVAEKAAERYKFTLIEDNVKYHGQHMWFEHPMKNMIMANMALTYGIRNNITTKIACGSFYTAHLTIDDFDVCAGDSIDMWHLYENVIRRIIPNFHMYICNANYHTAYRQILKEPELLQYTISCMTPVRFRELFRKRTQTNYNIELLPNRCGCCWKCATEYIFFCDHNVLEYDEAYYIHCLEVLLHTLKRETDTRYYDIYFVWSKYIFYPIKKSKAREILKNATISAGKIKITDNITTG